MRERYDCVVAKPLDYARCRKTNGRLPPDIFISGAIAIVCGLGALWCELQMISWLVRFRGALVVISMSGLVAFWYRLRTYRDDVKDTAGHSVKSDFGRTEGKDEIHQIK